MEDKNPHIEKRGASEVIQAFGTGALGAKALYDIKKDMAKKKRPKK